MSVEIQFEKALERLEKIVQDLEAGNVTLEDALKKYEEGVKLFRACQEKLVQAEKKIEILTKAKDGSLKRENFSEVKETKEGLAEDDKPKKATRTLSKKKAEQISSQDEDLLL